MKIPYLFLLSITILLLISCSKDANEKPNPYEHKLELILLGKGNLSPSDIENPFLEQQNIAIKENEDWVEFLNTINTVNNVSQTFSDINIDFQLFDVIATIDSVKRNGGHTIEMTSISENIESIIVNIEKKSDGNCGLCSVITQPYYIAKIPKRNKEIEFITNR